MELLFSDYDATAVPVLVAKRAHTAVPAVVTVAAGIVLAVMTPLVAVPNAPDIVKATSAVLPAAVSGEAGREPP